MTRRLGLIMPLLLCAACQGEAPVEVEEDSGREAEGEVLGGTISDDMLPLDQLRSRNPPLRPSTTVDGAGARAGAGVQEEGAGGDAAPEGTPVEDEAVQEEPEAAPEPDEG